MKGPYTYSLLSGPDELDSDTPPGVLRTVERFAALRAHEWVAADIVSEAIVEIRDANGKLVRTNVVYRATKGRHAGHVVSERVS